MFCFPCVIGAIEKSSTSATSAVCALVFAKPSFVAIRGKADLLQYVCNMQTDEKSRLQSYRLETSKRSSESSLWRLTPSWLHG